MVLCSTFRFSPDEAGVDDIEGVVELIGCFTWDLTIAAAWEEAPPSGEGRRLVIPLGHHRAFYVCLSFSTSAHEGIVLRLHVTKAATRSPRNH